MCNVGEFKAFCPDSCDTMTSNLPNRGGTFIGNEYRANIKMADEVPASEFVATNIINDDKGKEGDGASGGKMHFQAIAQVVLQIPRTKGTCYSAAIAASWRKNVNIIAYTI